MAAGPPRQLVLDLPPLTSAAREDFVAAPCNAEALARIDRWPDWPSRALLIVGPEGAGKSHLAAIWAAKAGVTPVSAASLPSADLVRLVEAGAVAVEDVAPGAAEAALFHLLNLVREKDAHLLLTTREPPAAGGYRLADLASRLRAISAVPIGAPDEALLGALVAKLFADRGVEVDGGVIRYLITRIERSVPALHRAVADIDAAALAARRPVTRALAAQVLQGVLREPGTDG